VKWLFVVILSEAKDLSEKLNAAAQTAQ